MKGELKRKSTRTVHGEKVVRLRIDIPYSQVEEVEGENQDFLKWLDANVDDQINFEVGPFEDDDQLGIEEI